MIEIPILIILSVVVFMLYGINDKLTQINKTLERIASLWNEPTEEDNSE